MFQPNAFQLGFMVPGLVLGTVTPPAIPGPFYGTPQGGNQHISNAQGTSSIGAAQGTSSIGKAQGSASDGTAQGGPRFKGS